MEFKGGVKREKGWKFKGVVTSIRKEERGQRGKVQRR